MKMIRQSPKIKTIVVGTLILASITPANAFWNYFRCCVPAVIAINLSFSKHTPQIKRHFQNVTRDYEDLNQNIGGLAGTNMTNTENYIGNNSIKTQQTYKKDLGNWKSLAAFTAWQQATQNFYSYPERSLPKEDLSKLPSNERLRLQMGQQRDGRAVAAHLMRAAEQDNSAIKDIHEQLSPRETHQAQYLTTNGKFRTDETLDMENIAIDEIWQEQTKQSKKSYFDIDINSIPKESLITAPIVANYMYPPRIQPMAKESNPTKKYELLRKKVAALSAIGKNTLNKHNLDNIPINNFYAESAETQEAILQYYGSGAWREVLDADTNLSANQLLNTLIAMQYKSHEKGWPGLSNWLASQAGENLKRMQLKQEDLLNKMKYERWKEEKAFTNTLAAIVAVSVKRGQGKKQIEELNRISRITTK